MSSMGEFYMDSNLIVIKQLPVINVTRTRERKLKRFAHS